MSDSGSFISDIGKRVVTGRHHCTIERVIAEGGYGVVFLVRDAHGRKFALKRLYVNDTGRLKDCKLEIDILSLLSGYKNVIEYVDSAVNRHSNGVYEVLILTHFYPATCTQLQEEQRVFSESRILKIFCDMCEALSVLHHCQTPIIHRDMKIENILMDDHSNYVLCDFGSATMDSYIRGNHRKSPRELEEDFHKHTTPSHRAPEIVDLYSNQSITTKLDIWALGVTLYRLCFNTLPFGESTLAIQNGHFSIPEHSNYSEKLISLIYYCLDVDPDKRPDIFQVASVAFHIIGRQSSINTNINNVPEPTIVQLVSAMKRRQQSQRSVKRDPSPRPHTDRSDWVETTTVRPRERPRAGKYLQPPVPAIHHPAEAHADPRSFQDNRSAVPAAALVDLSAQNGPMARSLDANSSPGIFVSHTSPFGDDFSQFDPTSAGGLPFSTQANSHSGAQANSRAGAQANSRAGAQANSRAGAQANSRAGARANHHTSTQQHLGFEDSFADLLIQSSAASQNQASQRSLMPPQMMSNSAARGHRRYKSDSASLLFNPRLSCPEQQTSSIVPMNGNSHNRAQPLATLQKSSANNFEDDFSSFTSYGAIPPKSQSVSDTPHGFSTQHQNNSVVRPLDEFGSEPFNPSLLA